jgi:periplasmic copper chaperone A
MSMSGVVMKIRRVDGIDIPAGRAVTLALGGFHLMMMELTKPLKAVQTFSLTLIFEKGWPRIVNVEVKKVGAMKPVPMPQH